MGGWVWVMLEKNALGVTSIANDQSLSFKIIRVT